VYRDNGTLVFLRLRPAPNFTRAPQYLWWGDDWNSAGNL